VHDDAEIAAAPARAVMTGAAHDPVATDSSVTEPPAWFTAYAARHRVLELCFEDAALPAPASVTAWAAAAPDGFLFDVDGLTTVIEEERHGLTAEERYRIWEGFRITLQPLRDAGRLGYVHVRYPEAFGRTQENIAALAVLHERLPNDRLAVELPPGAWFADVPQARDTVDMLEGLGLRLAIDLRRVDSAVAEVALDAAVLVRADEAAATALRDVTAAAVAGGAADTDDRPLLHVILQGPSAQQLAEGPAVTFRA
jgi:hypothetical protein